jgi:uncharacterized paraquat-inducible protein A
MPSPEEMPDRLKQAEKIMQEPTKYKICEGCESIVLLKANHCPNCHAYRFEANPEKVREQARMLSRREQRSVIAADLQ